MLEQIIENLMTHAKANPGKSQFKLLGNGLLLSVRFDNGIMGITLSRRNVLPSSRELDTVLSRIDGDIHGRADPIVTADGFTHHLHVTLTDGQARY
jgi:hypothetical protein